MAKFDARGLKSVRAHTMVKGGTYTMGFSKNPDTHRLVTFHGFVDAEGNPTEAPKVLKNMDPTHTMSLTVWENGTTPKPLTVVKDPDGYGAVFVKVGDKYKRVTFAADPDLISSLKKKKEEAQEAA